MTGMIIPVSIYCKKNMEIIQRAGISMPDTPPAIDPARETPIEQVFNTTFWDEEDFPNYQQNNALKSAIRQLTAFFDLSAQQQDDLIERIRTALDRGADPNLLMTEAISQRLLEDPSWPVTPLFVAVVCMIPRATKLLLENGAQNFYFVPNGQEINIIDFAIFITLVWLTIPDPTFGVRGPELNDSYAVLSLLVPDKNIRQGLIFQQASKIAADPELMQDLNTHRRDIYAMKYPTLPPANADVTPAFFILLMRSKLNQIDPD
jgi:hypothetical protein